MRDSPRRRSPGQWARRRKLFDKGPRDARDPKERATLEQEAEETREAAEELATSNQDKVDTLNEEIGKAQRRLSEAEKKLNLAKAGSRLSDTKALTDRLQAIVDEVAAEYDSGKLGPHPGDARAIKTGEMTPDAARGNAIDKEVKRRISETPDLNESLKTTKRGSEGVDIYDAYGRKWDITTPKEWKKSGRKGSHTTRYGEDTRPLYTRPRKEP